MMRAGELAPVTRLVGADFRAGTAGLLCPGDYRRAAEWTRITTLIGGVDVPLRGRASTSSHALRMLFTILLSTRGGHEPGAMKEAGQTSRFGAGALGFAVAADRVPTAEQPEFQGVDADHPGWTLVELKQHTIGVLGIVPVQDFPVSARGGAVTLLRRSVRQPRALVKARISRSVRRLIVSNLIRNAGFQSFSKAALHD